MNMCVEDQCIPLVAELVALRVEPGDCRQVRSVAHDLARQLARGWWSHRPAPTLSPVLVEALGHLGSLDDAAFSALLRRAANRGLIMRDEVVHRGVPMYRPVDADAAVGSKLDQEVERFRAGQRRQHPEDLPGQMAMFAGDKSQ